MSAVTIKIEGLDRLIKKLGVASNDLQREIRLGVRESSFALERAAKKALTTGHTRAIKTGRLRSDTRVRSVTGFRATVFPTVNYAIFIHEGTRFMRPRPFMRVAAKDVVKDVERIFDRRVKSLLRKIK